MLKKILVEAALFLRQARGLEISIEFVRFCQHFTAICNLRSVDVGDVVEIRFAGSERRDKNPIQGFITAERRRLIHR